jgi:hypothetical protein
MKLFLIIIFILILSALIIFESNNFQISESNDVKNFTNEYSSWINNIYTNIQSITGQAVKLNWLPE